MPIRFNRPHPDRRTYVRKDSNQTLTAEDLNALTFSTELEDDDGTWNSTAPADFCAARTGLHTLELYLVVKNNGTSSGSVRIRVFKDDSNHQQSDAITVAAGNTVSLFEQFELSGVAMGDEFSVDIYTPNSNMRIESNSHCIFGAQNA